MITNKQRKQHGFTVIVSALILLSVLVITVSQFYQFGSHKSTPVMISEFIIGTPIIATLCYSIYKIKTSNLSKS